MRSKKKTFFAICSLALSTTQFCSVSQAAGEMGSAIKNGGVRVANSLTAPFSDDQIAEIHARSDLANTIVKIVEADALAQGATESWRMNLLNMLYAVPSDALRNIAASAKTRDQALSMAAAAIAQNSAAAKAKQNVINLGGLLLNCAQV
jgi:hypothetical protein